MLSTLKNEINEVIKNHKHGRVYYITEIARARRFTSEDFLENVDAILIWV